MNYICVRKAYKLHEVHIIWHTAKKVPVIELFAVHLTLALF